MITIEEIGRGRTAFEDATIGECAFRLDSSGEGPLSWNQWSYRAGPPCLILRCEGIGNATLSNGDEILQRWADPLAALEWLQSTLTATAPAGAPPFCGGWIGYLNYDLGRWFEKLPVQAPDDLRWPLFEFTWHEQLVACAAITFQNCLVTAPAPIRGSAIRFSQPRPGGNSPPCSTFTRPQYERAVQKALDYIAAGDVFQINLSQRFQMPMRDSPADVYRRLRSKFPARLGALLDYGSHALISNSPELFLQVKGRHVFTRPIKGTRPRRQGMYEELRDSLKDQAELNMIVDLERNDLGRICEIGSVKVTSPRDIEEFPTVYHGVATIEGTLREDVGLVELLRATFPGGSVTGAPKIRAMQIIDELEPVRRGPYCGAIGYLSADGQIGLNIAIRTIVVNQGTAYVSVGGGIVADSKPGDEYEETLVKARAMFDALGVESIPQ